MNLPTKKNIDEYIEAPAHCPFCGSDTILTCGPIDADDTLAWQEMSCSACDKDWIDEYKLVGISISQDNRDRWYSEEATVVPGNASKNRDNMYLHEYEDIIKQYNAKH